MALSFAVGLCVVRTQAQTTTHETIDRNDSTTHETMSTTTDFDAKAAMRKIASDPAVSNNSTDASEKIEELVNARPAGAESRGEGVPPVAATSGASEGVPFCV